MKLLPIYNQLLNEDFKSQTRNYLNQGIEPEIVKSYIDKFKHIKDKKYKEMFDPQLEISVEPKNRNNIDAFKDFHELEQLVDYVAGQRPVSSNISQTSKNNGEEIEVSGEAVYKDENFEVYYADTPRACIKYKGKFPYSWCIARSDSSNMFYTYRFKPYEPAFYFIKNIKATEKEFGIWNMTKNVFNGTFKNKYHFFVLQVPKNINKENDEQDQYIVSSANNDGDKQMSWNDILKINPNLNKIKEVLNPKPFTPEEREKNERFKNGISDEDFARLNYEDKRNYLDIYPTIARPITTEQLKALPEDLLNLYVSFGIGLNDTQFEFIKVRKDILKRYTQISKRKLEEYLKRDGYERRQLRMMYSELIILSDNEIKSYLETLGRKEIKEFALNNDNGEQKLGFLRKHIPDEFQNEDVSLRELLINANNGDENSLEEIQKLVPEGISISFYNNDIIFDCGRKFGLIKQDLSDDVEGLYNMLDYGSYHGGYYDNDYFDGDEEGLTNAFNSYVEDYIKSNQDKKNDFSAFGLEWNIDTVTDLLETYKEDEDIYTDIRTEYSNGQEASENKEFKEISDKIKQIIYINGSDIEIKFTPFIMYLTHSKLFSTLEHEFTHHMAVLLNEILEDYDVPQNQYDIDEQVREAGWNFSIDNEAINNTIESAIDSALDKFADANASDDEEDNQNTNDNGDEQTRVAKLKSQIIGSLNNTLKSIGEEPQSSFIENEIVSIKIDRQKFHMDGKVFIVMTNKKTNETNSGYVYIKDIPNYFRNYKLFEQICKINKIIRY